MPDQRAEIIAQARARLGIPYGLPPGPEETDCSLFVLDAFRAAGVPFAAGIRTAEQERQACTIIDWPDVLPGDLLFFTHTYDAKEAPGPDGELATHVGISLGAGTHRMLNAVEPVSTETRIDTPYWQSHLLEARRPPMLTTSPGGAVTVPNMPRGVDVASYQGQPDWHAVAAAGITFAITKVTEDDDYTNPTFAYNWQGIRAANLIRGAYHFARPDNVTDAVQEADYFLSRLDSVGGLAAGDLLALDLESGSGDLGQWALDWLHRVESRVGFKPLVYTGSWFAGPHNLAAYPELGQFGLWLAAYQGSMPAPPPPWEFVAFWQYSDSGSVPGIAGNVDMSMFNGPADRLHLYGKPAGGTPLLPEPPPSQPVTRAELDAVIATLTGWRERVGAG